MNKHKMSRLTDEQKETVEKHIPLAISYVRKCCKANLNGVSHSDLVQEACLGIMRAVQEFDPERGAITTCAYQWMMSRVSSVRRSKYASFFPLEFKETAYVREDKEDERLGELDDHLRTLPSRLRFILEKCYFEGLTMEKVGELMGISRERVRQLKARALAKLRRKFDEVK